MHASPPAEQEVKVSERTCGWVPHHIGWFVIVTAIAQIPVVVVSFKMLAILPKAGWLLIGFTLPPALLLLAGGIGLVLRKMFGYYLIYTAILFSGIGGLKVAIIPELKVLLKGGFYVDHISLVANLLVMGVLVYFHIRDLDQATRSRRAHRWAMTLLLVLGAVSVGGGRALLDKSRGKAPNVQLIPYAGRAMPGLSATGPVQYYSVYTRLQRGLTCVVSARTTEEAVRALVAENKLVPVPMNKREKLLVQAKKWKLSPEAFPTEFAADDPCFTGRLKAHPRLNIQIGFRKLDQRFTAQVFGFVAPDKQ